MHYAENVTIKLGIKIRTLWYLHGPESSPALACEAILYVDKLIVHLTQLWFD